MAVTTSVIFHPARKAMTYSRTAEPVAMWCPEPSACRSPGDQLDTLMMLDCSTNGCSMPCYHNSGHRGILLQGATWVTRACTHKPHVCKDNAECIRRIYSRKLLKW